MDNYTIILTACLFIVITVPMDLDVRVKATLIGAVFLIVSSYLVELIIIISVK